MRKCELYNHCQLAGPDRMLEDHDLNPVPCLREDCGMIPLNRLVDHAQSNHGNVGGNQMQENTSGGGILCWNTTGEDFDATYTYASFFNNSSHLLFPRLIKRQGYYHFYIKMFGTEQLASRFMVEIEVGHRTAMIKLGELRVYPVEYSWDDIITHNEGFLSIDPNLAKRLKYISPDGQRKFIVQYRVRPRSNAQ